MRRGALAVALLALLVAAAPAAADQIAYSCGSDICLINPDNPEDHSYLTETVGSERSPSWSPDGTVIAYNGLYPGIESWDVWTLDPAKSAAAQEATNISESDDRSVESLVGPAWSPDGSKLAYAERFSSNEAPNLESEVYVSPFDGSADPLPIGSTSNKSELSPTWSPDGLAILFSRAGSILTAPANGAPEPKTIPNAVGYRPAYSPDGSQIATVYLFSDPEKIHVTNADGSNPHFAGGNTDLSTTIDWSPDSTQIAYVADEAVDLIRVAPADGSGLGHVIPLPEGWILPHHPAFSPDGTRIAFDARPLTGDTHEQLLVAPADGSAPAVPLTSSSVHNEEPDWKPCEGCAPPPKPPADDGSKTKTPTKIRLAVFKRVFVYPRLSVSVNCFAEGGHPDPKYCNGDGIAKSVTYTGLNPRPWAKPKLKKKAIVFAKGSVKVPGGKSKELKLKVTAAGKKLAKPGKTIKVQVTVKVSRDKEKAQTFKQTIKVKVPKKK